MKMIGIECPRCRLSDTVSASSLLLEVGSAAEDAGTSSAAWICDSCHELVALPVDLTVLITLVAAGSSVLDTSLEEARPAYPESTTGGRAFTRDDLLDFHEQLVGDTWLAEALSPTSSARTWPPKRQRP
jgi:hypothetical protein